MSPPPQSTFMTPYMFGGLSKWASDHCTVNVWNKNENENKNSIGPHHLVQKVQTGSIMQNTCQVSPPLQLESTPQLLSLSGKQPSNVKEKIQSKF